jgi:hypothetical protein
MYKLTIGLMLSFFSFSAMAQSLDDINKMMEKKQFREAKTAIDANMKDPKNIDKAESWYFKGRIYNSLAATPDLQPAEAYQLRLDAYNAFKKTQQLDSKDFRLKLENYISYLDIYFGMFDLGAGFFNNKDFDKAFIAFKSAIDVKDYILAKDYTYADAKLNALDTALVLNTAIAAMQAGKKDSAVTYYRKLTDANVSGPSYKEVYEFLADYYAKNEDAANLSAIMVKGRQHYPANEFWASLELDMLREKGDQATLFAKYDELMASNPTIFIIPYNYSIELYNSIYGRGEKPADENAAKLKLTEIMKKAIALDKNMDANLFMTKHLYNLSSDLSIAANLEKDAKKKADLIAKTNKQMDEFLEYANKSLAYLESQSELNNTQKAKFTELLVSMLEIYNFKKDTKKVAELEAKKAAL